MPNDRAYPTTPSTFPQPVFPPPSGSSQQSGNSQPQQPYPPPSAFPQAPQGYFAQPAYPQQYPQQQQQQPNYAYNNAQNAGYQGGRTNGPGTNDPNTGLAHQFSHQNLGGATRNAQYSNRSGASAAPRPRTAGNSSQPGPYGGYNNVPLPSQGSGQADFQPVPERNPDRYGSNATSNQKKCSQLAADFFKDSVKRARERNQR